MRVMPHQQKHHDKQDQAQVHNPDFFHRGGGTHGLAPVDALKGKQTDVPNAADGHSFRVFSNHRKELLPVIKALWQFNVKVF